MTTPPNEATPPTPVYDTGDPCCDIHSATCEPPDELCCAGCSGPTSYMELLASAELADGTLDWFFVCNMCRRQVGEVACPEHAPRDVPGLEIVSCGKPGHGRVWMLAHDGYPTNCPGCDYDALRERITFLERCRHWSWRRTRLFSRIASWAYGMGIVASYRTSFGGGEYGHHGCVHGFRWGGGRTYMLGWETWKWSCLLKKRHWPGEFVGLSACSKCLPCPDCGSTTGCFLVCDNAAQGGPDAVPAQVRAGG